MQDDGLYKSPEMSDQDVRLEEAEALGLAALLWDIAALPTTEHDRKVDAIHHAGFLEINASMPGAPTHTEITNEVVRYFKSVATCLQRDIELRSNGHAWTPTDPGHHPIKDQVVLWDAHSVVRLLWEVVTDSVTSSHYRMHAAHFACLLEHKIGAQLSQKFDHGDLEFYEKVIAFLKTHIQELSDLSNEQRNNRPTGWPPPPPLD